MALAEEQTLKAITCLETAISHFGAGGYQIEETQAQLYIAVAHWTDGNKQAALTHLECTLHLTTGLDSQHVLVIAGREAKEALEFAQSHKVIGRQVSRLLQQIAQFERDIPIMRRRLRRQAPSVPFVSPQLTIHTLGTPQILINGEPIKSPLWLKVRRVRELFFYFLAQEKGKGATRSTIGGVFWPEIVEKEVKLRYGDTLYRLRRAFENKDIVLFHNDEGSGYYAFNWSIDYIYDVEEFDRQIARAKTAKTTTEQVKAYKAAVDLYQGPYLAEVDREWAWLERQRLAKRYLEANWELAGYYLEGHKYREALRYCGKILLQDRSYEEAHRIAMRAHAGLGNNAAVIRQFQECGKVLREEVDAPVSDKTRELYQKLIG